MKQKYIKQSHISCYVTGNVCDKHEMIRLVVSPEGLLCFDIKHNLLGEDFFITNSRLIVIKFLQIMHDNGRFVEDYRCLVGHVEVNELIEESKLALLNNRNLVSDIEEIYIRQILSIISLAKKSGNLILGKEKISSSIKKTGIIVQARDASIKEKFSSDGKLEICEIFDIAQLSKACGKKNTRYLFIANQIAELFKKFYYKYNCYLKV